MKTKECMNGLIMTTGNTWATAGLAFTTFRELDIVDIANHVVGSFEALGHRVTSQHIISEHRALITTAQLELYLTAEEDVSLSALALRMPTYLSVAIASKDEKRTSTFSRDSALARSLQKLHEELAPDYVKWIDTDVVLSASDFAGALGLTIDEKRPAGKVVPRRVTPNKALPDIEETNDMLQQRITDQDPAIFDHAAAPDRLRKVFTENWVDPDILATEAAADKLAREKEDIERAAPLRLSAWFLSFAVALFALPLGIMLLILNCAKGENLRLASQTAALTGTFIGLQTFGSTAQAMTALQSIIG
ncbi:hypothetical protein [Roseovarius indicus]|uniref:Uncharacterized protein n=2 Tax=Roseovarius indicus TaxID=540747 RepID=A0A0T5P3Y6_9RHOB|nr:hypothetical protein [Roseovarius indicus]KRS15832.1 hypothetical protein XM52_21285 [Roseovarius indicus]QEW26452.1 hypothetical protein RIdsm_02251 [Roseovarius indicus]SFE62735.1 hypothetical protein SAMN04488031_11432 [Roseovarius indicus]